MKRRSFGECAREWEWDWECATEGRKEEGGRRRERGRGQP
jgi:hypothetical protein